jgi:hypothetical protein
MDNSNHWDQFPFKTLLKFYVYLVFGPRTSYSFSNEYNSLEHRFFWVPRNIPSGNIITLMCFGPLWVPINYFSGFQMTSTRCHAYFAASLHTRYNQQSLQQLLWCGVLTKCSFHCWMILRPETLNQNLRKIEVNLRVPNPSLIDYANNSNVRASPPHNGELHFYIKISECLMLNVPTQ